MQVGCCMCLHATTGFLCGFQDVYKGFSCIIRRAAAAADVLDETAPLVLQWNDVQSLIILFSWNVKYPHLTEGLKKKKRTVKFIWPPVCFIKINFTGTITEVIDRCLRPSNSTAQPATCSPRQHCAPTRDKLSSSFHVTQIWLTITISKDI